MDHLSPQAEWGEDGALLLVVSIHYTWSKSYLLASVWFQGYLRLHLLIGRCLLLDRCPSPEFEVVLWAHVTKVSKLVTEKRWFELRWVSSMQQTYTLCVFRKVWSSSFLVLTFFSIQMTDVQIVGGRSALLLTSCMFRARDASRWGWAPLRHAQQAIMLSWCVDSRFLRGPEGEHLPTSRVCMDVIFEDSFS